MGWRDAPLAAGSPPAPASTARKWKDAPVVGAALPSAMPAPAGGYGDALKSAPGLTWQSFKEALGGAMTALYENPNVVGTPDTMTPGNAALQRRLYDEAKQNAAEVSAIENVANRAAFRMKGVPQDAGGTAALDYARGFAEQQLPGRAMTNAAQEEAARIRAASGVAADSGPGLLQDAATSLGQMAPGVVGTMLARNPLPMIGSIAALSGGQKYGQSRQEGRAPVAALGDAAFFAGAEGIPELIPGMTVAKRGMKLIPRVAGIAGGEALTEGVTQAAQGAYDNLVTA